MKGPQVKTPKFKPLLLWRLVTVTHLLHSVLLVHLLTDVLTAPLCGDHITITLSFPRKKPRLRETNVPEVTCLKSNKCRISAQNPHSSPRGSAASCPQSKWSVCTQPPFAMTLRKHPQPGGFLSNPVSTTKTEETIRWGGLGKEAAAEGEEKKHPQITKTTVGCLYDEDM